MKKILTILWVIIITGAILIAIKISKPDSSTDINSDQASQNQTKNDTIDPKETLTLDLNSENKEQLNKTYSEYMEEGNLFLENSEASSAIQSFTSASILNPNSSDPLIALGEAYLKANNPAYAELAFLKAQDIDNTSIKIRIGIARSYLNQRNIEKAKNLVWELSTTDPLVKYYTAIILILYKDFEGSKNLFKELVAENEKESNKDADETPLPTIDPKIVKNSKIFITAYETFEVFTEGEQLHLQTLLAKALTDVGEFESAIPLLYDVINEKNNYRDAWIVLGYAYLNTDKILDSIDAFTQAKALDEEKPETLFFLGLAYFANNDIDNAIIYIEKADKNGFEPKDQINLKLGDLYLLKEKYSDSSKKYEEVISENTKNIGVFIRIVWLNIDKLDDPKKALKYAYKALENYPQEAMSLNLVGWSLTALNNFEEAKKYLAKALSIDPDFDAATLNLGWFYEKQGLNTLAKEYYKKAYILGHGNSITALAAIKFNKIIEQETQNAYYQVDISSP